MADWHRGVMVCFDLETTGVDVETDRIVSATVLRTDAARVVADQILIAVEIDIPAGAQKIHGISTEDARAHGVPTKVGLAKIVERLNAAFQLGLPVVGMNLSYDFTLLDRELRRHGTRPLPRVRPVVDVLVIDKQLDPFRKGGRKLGDLCRHYQVRHDGEHNAVQDALAAARVAYRLGQLGELGQSAGWRRFGAMSLDELHDAQVGWRQSQANSLRAHFNRTRQAHDGVDGSWPIRPHRP